MSDALRQAVDHYTRTHADAAGIAPTPVPGLFLVRGDAPGGLEHTVASPLVCLVLQGSKQVTLGNRDLSLSLIHISEPTRRYAISNAVFCLR